MAGRFLQGVAPLATLLSCAGAVLLGEARAAVVISTAQTKNMSCSAGVCAPTAADAVLNVSDLENLLASGNIEVTTTGAGVQADNIELDTPLIWSTTSALALDAYQSIAIDRSLSVEGLAGLSLTTNDGGSGGSLSFSRKAHATFRNISSQLVINGTTYTLVNSVKSLASAVAANLAGAFALANNYDASQDGTYGAAPVQGSFTGKFEGLGNAISHLSISPPGAAYVGLFSVMVGYTENLSLPDAKYVVRDGSIAGVLSAEGYGGHVARVTASGIIRGKGSLGNVIGGLSAGGSTFDDCYANVKIMDGKSSAVGGLVAVNGGSIVESFSSGTVAASGRGVDVGGLASYNLGSISDSYATGAVTGGSRSRVGGLVGTNGERGSPGEIATSYSTGAVSGGVRSKVGGFAGIAYGSPRHAYIQQSYWDTTTSGTNEGAGNGNEKGITGLTTEQLQSGLPPGFDPKVWAENPKINNGLPYLIDNPPPD